MPACNYKLFIREAETPEKVFYLVVKVSRIARCDGCSLLGVFASNYMPCTQG